MPRPIHVLFAATYPTSLAGSRLRAWQFGRPLGEAGIRTTFWSAFSDDDLEDWFGADLRGRVRSMSRALMRAPELLRAARRADVVVVLKQVLPLGPPVLEWLLARRCALVWDVDDTVWRERPSPTLGHVPQWIRATGDKYERICRWAEEVWAGSEELAGWCRQRNRRVRVLPTVVEVPDRRPPATSERVVGWIGSHSTGPFVEQILPALGQIDPPPTVVIVGAEVVGPDRLPVEQHAWDPAREERTLGEIRVGLYPVDRSHPLAAGKAGLKAVLYLSRGVPAVVTPTTTIASIVRDGVEGLHARTAADWTEATQRLLEDPELWERCSTAAHRRAREGFSLQVWAPRVARWLGELVRDAR